MSCVKQSVGWWWDNQIQTFSAVSVRDDVIFCIQQWLSLAVAGKLDDYGPWSKWIESSGFLVVFMLTVLQSVKPARWMSSAPCEDWCVRLLDGRLIADKFSRLCWERDWLLHCSGSVIPACLQPAGCSSGLAPCPSKTTARYAVQLQG
jgi:hypothetical protein